MSRMSTKPCSNASRTRFWISVSSRVRDGRPSSPCLHPPLAYILLACLLFKSLGATTTYTTITTALHATKEPYKKKLYFSKYEAAQELDAFHEQADTDLKQAQHESSELKKAVKVRDEKIQLLEHTVVDLQRQLALKEELTEQIARSEAQIIELNGKIHQLDMDSSNEIHRREESIAELKKNLEKAKWDFQQKKDECNSIISNSVSKSSYYDAMDKIKTLKEELLETRRDLEQTRAEAQKQELENANQRLAMSRLEALSSGGQGSSYIDWNALNKILMHRGEDEDPLDIYSIGPLLTDIDGMLPRTKADLQAAVDPMDPDGPKISHKILMKELPEVEVIHEKKSVSIQRYKDRAKMARRPEEFINSLLKEVIESKLQEDIYQALITSLHGHLSAYKSATDLAASKKKKGKKGAKGAAAAAAAAAAKGPLEIQDFQKYFVGLGDAPDVLKPLR